MSWRPAWLRGISSRLYLSIGLSSITVSLLLVASFIGLLPDNERQAQQYRAWLSETIAVTASSLIDENEPAALGETLEFLRQRNPTLLSIGVRGASGSLLASAGPHDGTWVDAAAADLPDGQVLVPVLSAGQPWGHVELRFEPLRSWPWPLSLVHPQLLLTGFVALGGFIAFQLYLRRMLRHLDPSRTIPARVRHALDTLTEGLLVLDARGLIVLANQSLATVLGRPAEEMAGHSTRGIHWLGRDGHRLGADELPWQQAIETGQVQRNKLVYVTAASGVRATFRTNCSPIIGPDGKQQGVLVSLQDVTELEEKEVALQAAKDEADHANQAKSRFLANMSHEIRTPMNAILGFTEVLRRGGGLRQNPESGKHLDIIRNSGQHLLALINDILDLSKVESGRLETEQIAYAPHTVLHDVLQTLAVRAEEKGLALHLQFPQPLPATLQGDPARLRQIVTNLLGNAIKFTEAGSVTLSARLEGAGEALRYCIDVADTGVGIAADKLESVFEPFVQAEASTTRRFGGTGLGLTISRGLARAMGGDITVRSQPGRGTTFTVALPVAVQTALLPVAELAAGGHAAEAAGPATAWRFPPARVLVVDDGAENRQLLGVLLGEAGLTVVEAADGAQGLARVADSQVDLVLMDMQMPVMDGLTATRRLRELGCTLPILALTANAMKGFEREVVDAGFDGFHTKPIDIDALLSDLAARLGGTRQAIDEVDATPPPAAAPTVPPAVAEPATEPQMPASAPAPAPELELPIDAPMTLPPIHSRLAHHPRLGKVAARFATQLPERLQAMDEALRGGDLAELASLAHWLKGAGGSMGYDELFEPARDLDEAAKGGDTAAAGVALATLQGLQQRMAVPDAAAPALERETAT